MTRASLSRPPWSLSDAVCLLQVAASSGHPALPAGLAHGLQRSLQEAGGGRQRRRQEVHGGQRAAAGGDALLRTRRFMLSVPLLTQTRPPAPSEPLLPERLLSFIRLEPEEHKLMISSFYCSARTSVLLVELQIKT